MNTSLDDYDALDCPICEKECRPTSINADGSVTYRCNSDAGWQEGMPAFNRHANTYVWRISESGDLLEKQGRQWVAA